MNNITVETDHKTPNTQNPAEYCVSCSKGNATSRRAFCLTAGELVQAG